MDWHHKKNFEDYFKIIKEFEDNSPIRIAIQEGDIYSVNDIDSYIELLKKFYREESNNEYVKNIKIFPVVRRHFPVSEIHDEWANKIVRARLIERRQKFIDSGENPTYYFRSPYSPKDSYFHKLSKQLYEYLYVDRFLQNERKINLQKKMREFLKIASEIRELIDISGVKIFPMSYFHGGQSGSKIERDAETIEIERNSTNLPERIFVKNMLDINYLHYKGPKIKKIEELMCLPFFVRQLDTSTISRINAKMQEQKRAASEARKAMAKARGE